MILILPPGAGAGFAKLAASFRYFLFRSRTALRSARAGWRHPSELDAFIAPVPPIIRIIAEQTVVAFELADGRRGVASHYVLDIPIHGPLHSRTIFEPPDPTNHRWLIPGDSLRLSCGTTFDAPTSEPPP